jgi:hypothetical protein
VGKKVDGNFTVKRAASGKPQYGFFKREKARDKRESVEQDLLEREVKRQDAQGEGGQTEGLRREKARKRKGRQKVLKTREGRERREVLWSPYGKRLRRHGQMKGRTHRRTGGQDQRRS